MLKRLPTLADDVANAQDAASDTLSGQDSPWQSAVLPLDHSGGPSAATGEEGIGLVFPTIGVDYRRDTALDWLPAPRPKRSRCAENGAPSTNGWSTVS